MTLIKSEERVKKISKVMMIIMKVFSILILVSIGLTVVGLIGIIVSPENFSVQFEKLHLTFNGMVPDLFMGSVQKTRQLLIYYLTGNILSFLVMITLHKFFKQIKEADHVSSAINVKALKTVAVVMVIRGITLSCLNVMDECFSTAFDIVDFNFMDSIIGIVIFSFAILLEYLVSEKESRK